VTSVVLWEESLQQVREIAVRDRQPTEVNAARFWLGMLQHVNLRMICVYQYPAILSTLSAQSSYRNDSFPW
jgi:hypothetical protein